MSDELKPCAGATDTEARKTIIRFLQSVYPTDNLDDDEQEDWANGLMDCLSDFGFNIARAEPAAPSSDAVRAAFKYLKRLMQWQYVKEKYGADPEGILHAHIAELEADNKRLHEEVKQKTSALWFIENGTAEGVSNRDMVCLMRQEARAVLAAWSDAEWQAALAQSDGKAGE